MQTRNGNRTQKRYQEYTKRPSPLNYSPKKTIKNNKTLSFWIGLGSFWGHFGMGGSAEGPQGCPKGVQSVSAAVCWRPKMPENASRRGKTHISIWKQAFRLDKTLIGHPGTHPGLPQAAALVAPRCPFSIFFQSPCQPRLRTGISAKSAYSLGGSIILEVTGPLFSNAQTLLFCTGVFQVSFWISSYRSASRFVGRRCIFDASLKKRVSPRREAQFDLPWCCRSAQDGGVMASRGDRTATRRAFRIPKSEKTSYLERPSRFREIEPLAYTGSTFEPWWRLAGSLLEHAKCSLDVAEVGKEPLVQAKRPFFIKMERSLRPYAI